MQIDLDAAVVHVLDTAIDAPSLSELPLVLNEELVQYLGGHAGKCFLSEEARACALADDSAVAPLLWNIEDDFVQKSAALAREWFVLMQQNVAIPAGDVAFLLLHIDGVPYFAALKMNYKTGYLHYYAQQDGRARNDIVRQSTVLPGMSGKADEAFFIQTQTHAVTVLEKKYDIDGHKRAYLASDLLGCRAAGLSPKEKLSAVKAAAAEVNQRFYGNTGVDEPELAAAVCEEYYAHAEEGGQVPIAAVCEKLYGDMPHAREAFTNVLAEQDIALEEPLPLRPAAVHRLEKQSLRSGSGVEVKVPVSLYRDENALQFIHNDDGTTSLLIKNILM